MHDYYKYQNARTVEEYEMLLNEKIIMGQPNKVIEIPIFRNCEFDIERLEKNYEDIVSTICDKEMESPVDATSLKSPLYYYLTESHSSYLAPAYNFNCYINLLLQLNISKMNGEKDEKLAYADYYYTILIQNVFVSIKSLLDRTVPILSFFENGISLTSTFGHVDEKTQKAKGLMSHVMQYKDSNEILQFIYEEYMGWIKTAVRPRDTVMHYNDLKSYTRYTADGREFPMHHHVKIFGQKSEERELVWDDGFYYKSILKNVQDAYFFFDSLMLLLSKCEIKYSKQHFKNPEDYDRYIEKSKFIVTE